MMWAFTIRSFGKRISFDGYTMCQLFSRWFRLEDSMGTVLGQRSGTYARPVDAYVIFKVRNLSLASTMTWCACLLVCLFDCLLVRSMHLNGFFELLAYIASSSEEVYSLMKFFFLNLPEPFPFLDFCDELWVALSRCLSLLLFPLSIPPSVHCTPSLSHGFPIFSDWCFVWALLFLDLCSFYVNSKTGFSMSWRLSSWWCVNKWDGFPFRPVCTHKWAIVFLV